jgi:predicted RecB family nuclease
MDEEPFPLSTLNKSLFIAGVQCLKRLHLLVHQPELAAKVDAAAESILEQGHLVGMLARRLFPGGVAVNEDNIDLAIRATRELITNPDVPAIFEGTFEHGGVLVRADILHRRRDGRWRLIEVKSTTEVKDHHRDDVAIQYRVLSRSGADVASICLAHINRNYIYPGADIDVWRFFRIKNLTRRVKSLQPKLTFHLCSEFTVLNMSNAPDITPGGHCTDPITCEFFDHCNPPRPNDHIAFLPRIHASVIEELDAIGVDSIMDIPDAFELSEIQRRAATCVQTGEPWFHRDGLAEKLATLRYPIAYLDFESLNPAIPRFSGMHPFDHICFQFSLHTQSQPGSAPEHYEFLADDANDPRREFISLLCSVLGDSGNIVVYSSFESQRLSELASWFPEFADRINAIQTRLFDLLPTVREHTYHPAYAGSYSIKAVLPALVPEMSYQGMEIANGQDAGLAWESLLRAALSFDERQRIEKALLDYCALDTLAMVRLLEKLKLEEIVS